MKELTHLVNFTKDNIRMNSIYLGVILSGAAEHRSVTDHAILGKAFDISNGYLYLNT